MSEETPIVAGRYRLEEKIGRGGMGDVYRGVDLRTNELVAVKLLHQSIVEENPDIVDRFRREGEALRQLDHPNIVQLLDAFEDSGQHYLVMEYVSGGSLRDLIDEQSRLPLEGVLNVALDLADALTRAHRMNIIHRDIKPDNVLLAEDGTPRLTDFGVAHLGDRTRLTQTGSVIGTYAYLSPEACNGLELDERTDIWSFGVMLFEMLTGRVPFQESSTAAILTSILTKPAPDITRLRPGIPLGLADLIYRMLEKDRERRIASVRLIGVELEALIRGLDTPLRSVLLQGEPNASKSRFATPSDQGSNVPAMERRTPDQTHGFSLYPSPGGPAPAQGAASQVPASQALPPYYTPGGTPLATGEMPAASSITKWKWIALMVIVTVLACSVVAVVAIILGPEAADKTDHVATAPAGGEPLAPGADIPQVEPVEAGQYMVLVAQFENLGGIGQLASSNRDVTRFVYDNLHETLEETVPFSDVRVRRYPGVVTSDDEARAAAAVNDAIVVVWGNYTPDLIELNVQIGSTTPFKHNVFERDVLERTANVRIHMTNERTESVAPAVLGVLNVLQNADGDGFEMLRTSAIQGAIDVQSAEIVGTSVAADVHHYFIASSDAQGRAYLDDALDLDPGNPLLYAYSSIQKQRQGLFEESRRDIETAQRLGPDGWVMPTLLLANITEDSSVIGLFDAVIAQRPEDWFPLFFRGAIYYELDGTVPDGYTHARADLDAAITLHPNASFPYVYSALLAMHEGRLADAGQAIYITLNEYPNPSFMQRLVSATFGDRFLTPYAVTLSAFTNLMLGRHNQVIQDTQAGLAIYPDLSDLFLLQGMSYCALSSYRAAATSFSQLLQRDPAFMLAYLMRASVRLSLNNEDGANDDFGVIESSPQADTFAPFIAAIKDGATNCGMFFSPENTLIMPVSTGMPASTGQPVDQTPTPVGAVETVKPGDLMVLVTRLEPLDGVTERDVARFIADNLARVTGEDLGSTAVGVSRDPALITSDADALALAQETGATIVVWGNYTPDVIELNIQIGVTDAFPLIPFDQQTLERTANVRVHLTDERRESIAPQVLAILNLLATADGDEYGMMLWFTLIDALDVTGAEIVGNSLAAHMHRALVAYDTDPQQSIDELTAAIAVDASSVLAYFYRGLAYLRTGAESSFAADLETARRLAPDNWAGLTMMEPHPDLQTALDAYSRAVTLRPDDWFVYFMRGTLYYYALQDFDAARADFERSIALGPQANLPFIPAMLLALRQGRLADAQAYMDAILTRYPDAELTNRAFQAVYGSAAVENYSGLLFSAATNLVLGQYDRVVTDVQIMAENVLSLPESQHDEYGLELADMYALQGIAYCNLDEIESAEAAYTQALRISPDFTLLYLLRGQVRQVQGNASAARNDFAVASQHTLGPGFEAWVQAGITGRWSCKTLQDYTPPG